MGASSGRQQGGHRAWPHLGLGRVGRSLLLAVFVLCGADRAWALDANTASQAELEELRGIGPVISARIIEERTKNGTFHDMDDLRERVRGIGVASQKKLVAAGLQVSARARAGARTGDRSAAAQPGTVERQAWVGRSGVVYYDPHPLSAPGPTPRSPSANPRSAR